MKYFYQKIISVEILTEQLNGLELSDEERAHLGSLVDSSMHHAILDEVLSNLSDEDKHEFLKRIDDNPEDERLLDFLRERVDNIEGRISKVSDDLVKEMHKDIKEAKEK